MVGWGLAAALGGGGVGRTRLTSPRDDGRAACLRPSRGDPQWHIEPGWCGRGRQPDWDSENLAASIPFISLTKIAVPFCSYLLCC